MRVYLGADHAGYELKQALLDHLTAAGHQAVDCGAFAYDAEDDYPAFCIDAAKRTVDDPGSLGIVIGGSGNGEQIAANMAQPPECGGWNAQVLDEKWFENCVPDMSKMDPLATEFGEALSKTAEINRNI